MKGSLPLFGRGDSRAFQLKLSLKDTVETIVRIHCTYMEQMAPSGKERKVSLEKNMLGKFAQNRPVDYDVD